MVPVDCETCNGSDNLGSGSIQNNDDDGDGVCNDAEVLGCTNENSANYDIDATDDDGSCHPYISNPIDNITIDEDDPDITIDLSNHFIDPEGLPLTYIVSHFGFDNNGSINTSVNGDDLTISISSDYFDSEIDAFL